MKVGFPTTDNALQLGPALNPEAFSKIRRRMMLDYFKWDTQIGDESVLLEQPLILPSKTWAGLAAAAEQMAAEIAGIEIELLERPKLQAILGLPVQLQVPCEAPRTRAQLEGFESCALIFMPRPRVGRYPKSTATSQAASPSPRTLPS